MVPHPEASVPADTSRFSALLRVNLLLALLGAVMGALVAIPFTWIGHWVTEAPWPLSIDPFIWNMWTFGIMGALFGPVLAWSALRRVPLWRAALEPALGCLIGGTAGLVFASVPLMYFLALGGSYLAAWRLRRRFGGGEHAALPGQHEPQRLSDTAS